MRFHTCARSRNTCCCAGGKRRSRSSFCNNLCRSCGAIFRQRSCTFGGGFTTRVPFPLPRCAFCGTPAFGGRSFLRFSRAAGALPPLGAERGGGESFGGRCCAAAAAALADTISAAPSPSVHSHPPNWRPSLIALHLCIRVHVLLTRIIALRQRQITQRVEIRQHIVIFQHRQIADDRLFRSRTRPVQRIARPRPNPHRSHQQHRRRKHHPH